MPWCLTVGLRSEIEADVTFKITDASAEIRVGDRVFIGRGTILDISESLIIDSGVLIAPGCFITDHNHGIEGRIPIGNQACCSDKIVIERDAWLGAGVIVLPGVQIGEGAVIGAGSVVTEDIPPFALAVGSPAVVVRTRF